MRPAKETPWAQRFTFAAMFIYVGKVGDLYPQIAPYGLGKIFIGLALIALVMEGGGWFQGVLRHPIIRPFEGMVLLAIMTLPFSIWPGNSFRYLAEVMIKDLVFIFLLIATIQTKKDLRRAFWVFGVSVLFLDSGLLHYGHIAVSEMFVGRNEIAMYSVIALALLLPLQVHGVARIIKSLMIIVIVSSVIASHSRGSYVGIAVVIASFLYFRLGGRIAVTSVVFMLVVYVAYVQLPSDYRGSVDSIINYQEDYNVTAQEGRLEIWKRGLTMVKNNPFTGVGVNNFAVAEGLMHAQVRGQPWLTAHNSPLQVAGEIGLVGLAFYLVLVVRMFRSARRMSAVNEDAFRVMGRALLLGMIAYAVTGSFLSQGFAVVFYVLIAFVFIGERVLMQAPTGKEERAQSPTTASGPEMPKRR